VALSLHEKEQTSTLLPEYLEAQGREKSHEEMLPAKVQETYSTGEAARPSSSSLVTTIVASAGSLSKVLARNNGNMIFSEGMGTPNTPFPVLHAVISRSKRRPVFSTLRACIAYVCSGLLYVVRSGKEQMSPTAETPCLRISLNFLLVDYIAYGIYCTRRESPNILFDLTVPYY
jgi:hypothetical protein